jgi:hypothetical protein
MLFKMIFTKLEENIYGVDWWPMRCHSLPVGGRRSVGEDGLVLSWGVQKLVLKINQIMHAYLSFYILFKRL